MRSAGTRELDAVEPVGSPNLVEGVAIRRCRAEDSVDQEAALVRDPLSRWSGVDAIENAALEFGDSLCAKRQRPDDHEVQKDSERPDVDVRPVVAVVTEQFGGGVRRGATERRQGLTWATVRTESEITYFDLPRPRKENVFGFQVSMYNLLIMLSTLQTTILLIF